MNDSATDDRAYLVFRRWPRWAYCVRRFDIVMNKEKVGSIANGKEQVIAVSPGCHVVQLQVSGLFKSQRQVVDVKPGEKVLLECGTPFTLWKVLVLLALIQILNLLGYFGDWERVVSMSGLFLLICYGVFRLRRPGKSIRLNEPIIFKG